MRPFRWFLFVNIAQPKRAGEDCCLAISSSRLAYSEVDAPFCRTRLSHANSRYAPSCAVSHQMRGWNQYRACAAMAISAVRLS